MSSLTRYSLSLIVCELFVCCCGYFNSPGHLQQDLHSLSVISVHFPLISRATVWGMEFVCLRSVFIYIRRCQCQCHNANHLCWPCSCHTLTLTSYQSISSQFPWAPAPGVTQGHRSHDKWILMICFIGVCGVEGAGTEGGTLDKLKWGLGYGNECWLRIGYVVGVQALWNER